MSEPITKHVGTIVHFSIPDCRALVDAYRSTSRVIAEASTDIAPILRQASLLVSTPSGAVARDLEGLAIELSYEGDDVSWRVDFIEATDGLGFSGKPLHFDQPLIDWEMRPPGSVSISQLASLLAHVENQSELETLLDWLVDDDTHRYVGPWQVGVTIPEAQRVLFAGSFATAYTHGWRPDQPLPAWIRAGIVKYGNPSDELMLDLAFDEIDEPTPSSSRVAPNPFALGDDETGFAPFAAHLAANPRTGRRFLEELLGRYPETGDTPLDMHSDGTARTEGLARIVVAVGTTGTIIERTAFTEELIKVINADGDTSREVAWAAWEVHARLQLDHGVTTTSPSFGTHHLLPDAVRPAWDETWHRTVSPQVLRFAFTAAENGIDLARLVDAGTNPTVLDLYTLAFGAKSSTGNDAGGTYTTRPKQPFAGSPTGTNKADQGRNILTHTLYDSSDGGDIAQDEFAIISHGIGPNGRATYTVNLPGVIDLSNPHPGWDDEHQSVRDMDMAALRSAPTADVADNLYAQMVIQALEENGIEHGANLLLIGHSFGADTVADLAADPEFAARYTVTHVVAAAYDSGPQLASISPDINVLILQNEDDQAIAMEAMQRNISAAPDVVSIDTFAHEVRRFDGGMGSDIGHHQRRYINYLEGANDPTITAFYESLTDTGYGAPGSSVAIDVTLDEGLIR